MKLRARVMATTVLLSSALSLVLAEPFAGLGGDMESKFETDTSMQSSATAIRALPFFEANLGQFPEDALFGTRIGRQVVLLGPAGVDIVGSENPDGRLVWTDSRFVMRFGAANAPVRPVPIATAEGISNYFLGANPAEWLTRVPHFSMLAYPEVSPGVSLVFHWNESGQLEYDLLGRHADPARFEMRIAGPHEVGVDQNGRQIARVGKVQIVLQGPVDSPPSSLLTEGRRGGIDDPDVRVVPARPRAKEAVLAPLSMDPGVEPPAQLAYSTFLGGLDSDNGASIAVDAAGNAYVTGNTFSVNFPVHPILPPTAYQTEKGVGYDAFVSKFNPTGGLVYSTFLGGDGLDWGTGIAVDSNGNAFVTGWTTSEDFPTRNAFQVAYAGDDDAFVSKLNSDGTDLVYSSYLGGSRSEGRQGLDAFFIAQKVSVDSLGQAHVVGTTLSDDFPLQDAFQVTRAGGQDIFVTKVGATGNALLYSTYLGGSGLERGMDVVVDGTGRARVAGQSASVGFPLANPLQSSLLGDSDGTVSIFNADGSALDYSTFLGGSVTDMLLAIDVDAGGNTYLAGSTNSEDFPLQNAYQAEMRGVADVVVVKLQPGGQALAFSTYLGGSALDEAAEIAVGPEGAVYVTGVTASDDFPHDGTLQAGLGGVDDAFVANFTADGSSLHYSSYLGGLELDHGIGIDVDAADNAFVVGYTSSANFPITVGAFQPAKSGGRDAFVAKIKSA